MGFGRLKLYIFTMNRPYGFMHINPQLKRSVKGPGMSLPIKPLSCKHENLSLDLQLLLRSWAPVARGSINDGMEEGERWSPRSLVVR